MDIASGLAIAGIPRVIGMLNNGDADPIWNLSDAICDILMNTNQSDKER